MGRKPIYEEPLVNTGLRVTPALLAELHRVAISQRITPHALMRSLLVDGLKRIAKHGVRNTTTTGAKP